MSGYDYTPDPAWRTPDPETKEALALRPSPRPKPKEPNTFRESFSQLPEPYRSTFLRVGAAMLDLDDPAVFENACRLADSTVETTPHEEE